MSDKDKKDGKSGHRTRDGVNAGKKRTTVAVKKAASKRPVFDGANEKSSDTRNTGPKLSRDD